MVPTMMRQAQILCVTFTKKIIIIARYNVDKIAHYKQSWRNYILDLLRFTCDCSSISSAWVMPATTVYGLPPRSRLLVSNRDKVGVLYIYS